MAAAERDVLDSGLDRRGVGMACQWEMVIIGD